MEKINFRQVDPTILYFGTPVALITTVDDKGHPNIGPISSVWALGWTMVLGLECASKTFQNLQAQKECVINFPGADQFEKVEKIASLTGADPVPEYKKGKYRFDPDKFKTGNFHPMPSQKVAPPRISECRLQFEATLINVVEVHDDPKEAGPVAAVLVRIATVHADELLVVKENHIDPVKWKPLIYNFRHYYGLGNELGKTFKADV